MKYARIIDNHAVEVFTPMEGFTLQDSFHPDIAMQFVEVPEEVTAGSTKNEDNTWAIFIAPEPRSLQPEGLPPASQPTV